MKEGEPHPGFFAKGLGLNSGDQDTGVRVKRLPVRVW